MTIGVGLVEWLKHFFWRGHESLRHTFHIRNPIFVLVDAEGTRKSKDHFLAKSNIISLHLFTDLLQTM